MKELGDMKMNRKNEKLVYCPVEKDMVDERHHCGHCPFWDGLMCTVGDGLHSTRRAGSITRYLRRFVKGMRRPRRGGRGLRVPPVWERWPVHGAQTEDPSALDEESAPGVPGLHYDNGERYEPEDDASMLADLTGEQPDLPDVVSGQESSAPMSSGPLVPDPPVFADDPQSEPFPPGTGQGPDIEKPDDGFPGFPPDSFNEPMP